VNGRRSLGLRPLLLVVAFAAIATPAIGQGVLEVIGPRERAIPAGSADASTVVLPDIAVGYEPGDAAWTSNLRTIGVELGGRAVDPAAFALALARDESGEPVLRVTVDLTRAPEAGSYDVVVRVTHEGQAAPEPQLLEFTFTRPAAVLRIGTPIRIERVIAVPWRPAPLAPRELLLSETGGSAAFVPAQRIWWAELRGAQGLPVEGRLRVTLPEGVAAWGQATAGLAIDGALPLGTVTGTVTVRSQQFAERALDYVVEVVSRHHPLWLFAPILVGILLGWLVRDRMEDRRQRTRARVAAEAQRGRLHALIEDTVDPGLGDALQKIMRDLGAAIAEPLADAEALNRAAKEAEEQTEFRLKAAEEKRLALGGTIATLRASLGTPEGQPREIAALLENTLRRLADHEHQLTRGSIHPVENLLETEGQSLPVRLHDHVNGWLTKISNGLQRMGPWPGTVFERAEGEISAEITAIRGSLGTTSSPEQISALLGRTRTLAQRVRHDLLDSGRLAIEQLAEDVLRALGDERDATLEPALEQLRRDLVTLHGVPRDETELPRLAGAVHALRNSLAAALSAAVPAPTGGAMAAEPEALGRGDFGGALEAVIALRDRPTERVLGGMTPVASGSRPGLLRPGPEAPVRTEELGAPAWALQIVASPALPRAGEPISLHAEVVVPDGFDAPQVSIAWEVGGRPSASGLPADAAYPITPRRSGPLAVRATAVDAASGSRAAAEIVLQVRPTEGFAAVRELSQQVRRYEVVQTGVSGILIAAAGFVIFEGAFLGTYGDYLAALLWGFSVDIGLARVRELAAPHVGRTLPAPAER
jgi:hypothetical protein